VADSGLQGAVAAFPMGRKWGVVNLDDGQPITCANADEGEPGTFRTAGSRVRPHLP
jgi:NADH:ubiquinone oxidoreductase subunit F (NADH-binding)